MLLETSIWEMPHVNPPNSAGVRRNTARGAIHALVVQGELPTVKGLDIVELWVLRLHDVQGSNLEKAPVHLWTSCDSFWPARAQKKESKQIKSNQVSMYIATAPSLRRKINLVVSIFWAELVWNKTTNWIFSLDI